MIAALIFINQRIPQHRYENELEIWNRPDMESAPPKKLSGLAKRSDTHALFADLYELTMMQAYLRENMTEPAVFSLFVRKLPACRNYLIACGLDSVLQIIERLQFTKDDVSYLKSLGHFTPDFLEWLQHFCFKGDIYAVPEGTAVFQNEPIMEIVAPLLEAQFFETIIMNQIHLQTLMASKAARVVRTARGKRVIDFGARRMHGTDAANKAARAFYIAGVEATSNLSASRQYPIPAIGTMGHSYIQAHDSETEAFLQFSNLYPNTVLLIDTYDTLAGAKRVIELARRPNATLNISGVRLDSGDLAALAREVRGLLDTAGMQGVEIIASGGLDEYKIEKLVQGNAPIDCFAVGTAMGVSSDAPALDVAYKLTEYAGEGRLKRSSGKATLPGRKQVFRNEEGGRFAGDEIARYYEERPGRTLLRCVMKAGQRTLEGSELLRMAHSRAQDELARIPPALYSLAPCPEPYPVAISTELTEHERNVRRKINMQQGLP